MNISVYDAVSSYHKYANKSKAVQIAGQGGNG